MVLKTEIKEEKRKEKPKEITEITLKVNTIIIADANKGGTLSVKTARDMSSVVDLIKKNEKEYLAEKVWSVAVY